MNLPFILDIAIGLIFIYLILSLLASEIQELLTTLLQWRAVHLKRSIEILLTGGEGTGEEQEVKTIVSDLYDNPLIKNINHEAKKGIEGFLRQFTWGIADFYRKFRKQESTLGKEEVAISNERTIKKERRSGPSYIPSETFATTLLERIGITQISHSLTSLNLQKLKENEIKKELRDIVEPLEISQETRDKLNRELADLSGSLDKIFINFKNEKATLVTSLTRMKSELDLFLTRIESSERYFENDKNEVASKNEFIQEGNRLKNNIFSADDKQEDLVARLQPNLSHVLDTLNTSSKIYQGLKTDIGDENSEIYKAFQEIDQDIQAVIGKLPPKLRESLAVLARRAQLKATNVQDELRQYKTELENWFDSSMERASGVYKRNAKGVAFLIGLVLAILINADTFHIINRLSKDSVLRNAITTSAAGVVDSSQQNCIPSDPEDPSANPTGRPPSKLECLRNEVNQTLSTLSLPIGRTDENIRQQERDSRRWNFYGLPLGPAKILIGWVVSGLAISMGASFWFELLGKIINVRNTGSRPRTAKSQNSDD